MERQCFNEINKIEKFIGEIPDFVDAWRNLVAQLKAVQRIPRYTSLVQCSSQWQMKLVARIEHEIDAVVTELSEQWKQVERAAEMLNDYWLELQFRETAPSYSFRDDLRQLLVYVMDEVSKWCEVQNKAYSGKVVAFTGPTVQTEEAIARCKQSLQTFINKASRNF